VLQWRRDLLESVKGTGATHSYTSPFGCVRTFMEPRSEAERSIYNYPLQHCASQIINAAMVRLHTKYNAPIVLQMHDELILEVPNDEIQLWDDRLRTEMEAPVAELGGVVFPTAAGQGATWGDL
jgi:DNA polymerase-1